MLKPYYDKKLIEVGCDEAGRGCLAGPVVAAAVILPKGFKNKELNDSKRRKVTSTTVRSLFLKLNLLSVPVETI